MTTKLAGEFTNISIIKWFIKNIRIVTQEQELTIIVNPDLQECDEWWIGCGAMAWLWRLVPRRLKVKLRHNGTNSDTCWLNQLCCSQVSAACPKKFREDAYPTMAGDDQHHATLFSGSRCIFLVGRRSALRGLVKGMASFHFNDITSLAMHYGARIGFGFLNLRNWQCPVRRFQSLSQKERPRFCIFDTREFAYEGQS